MTLEHHLLTQEATTPSDQALQHTLEGLRHTLNSQPADVLVVYTMK